MVVAWHTYLHTYKPYSQNNEGEPATDLASRNEAVILLEEEAEVDPENLPESEGVSHESLTQSNFFKLAIWNEKKDPQV